MQAYGGTKSDFNLFHTPKWGFFPESEKKQNWARGLPWGCRFKKTTLPQRRREVIHSADAAAEYLLITNVLNTLTIPYIGVQINNYPVVVTATR